MTSHLNSRAMGGVLTAAIVGLTLATGYIHFSLGGLLFWINAAGYAALAAAIVVGAIAPIALVARFSWAPRTGLFAYTLTTIVAWAVMGPYFSLAFTAKAIEVTLLVLLTIDIARVYGSPVAMFGVAWRSLAPMLPSRFRPASL